MNEWGVPDWRDGAAYLGEADWPLSRWQWEFLRRRDDLRREFDAKKSAEYELDEAWAATEHAAVPFAECPSPDMAGFCVPTFLIEPDFPAPTSLPNPRIGDQPLGFLPRIKDNLLTQIAKRDLDFDSGYHRVDFDLSRPIEPQLKAAKKVLKSFQKYHAGKVIGKRRQPEKWPTYLRLLDARDAGASWSEIADGVYGPSSSHIEDWRAEVARKAYRAAETLCYNF